MIPLPVIRATKEKKSYYTGLGFDIGVIALICSKANATEYYSIIHVESGAPS